MAHFRNIFEPGGRASRVLQGQAGQCESGRGEGGGGGDPRRRRVRGPIGCHKGPGLQGSGNSGWKWNYARHMTNL
jgi:hypothetical protein